uniref:Uncharacterized protein n=1 Tax=Theileria parva TaxID=5875 RepID=Q4N0Y0_THEPA|eukprot:XP_763184.1 hypothetical protein [Theileria parva strain Muguga]
MSYGWLTESTLGPKKPKEITVPKGSIASLNNIIKRHIQKDNEKHEQKRKYKKVWIKFIYTFQTDLFELSNPGVELRNKIDRKESTINRRDRRKKMEEKAKLYNQMKEGKLDPGENSEFLVDFKRKIQTDQEDLKEGEEG